MGISPLVLVLLYAILHVIRKVYNVTEVPINQVVLCSWEQYLLNQLQEIGGVCVDNFNLNF